MSDYYASRHWTMQNAVDTDVSDLPMLLRRVADQIEADGITAMELLDVTVGQEREEEGLTWRVSVYWSPEASSAGRARIGCRHRGTVSRCGN